MNKLTINVLPKVLENPVVDAGPDITITLPTNQVSITAIAVDDGEIESYLWSLVPSISHIYTPTLVDPTQPTLVVKDLIAGEFTFKVIVTDDDGLTGEDTVRVVVINPNRPPVSIPGQDQSIDIGWRSGLLDNNFDIVPLGNNTYRFKLDGSRAAIIRKYYEEDLNNGLQIKVRYIRSDRDNSYHIGLVVGMQVGFDIVGVIDIRFIDVFNPILSRASSTSGLGTQSNIQLIFRRRYILLDGSGSFDPEGTQLTYEWRCETVGDITVPILSSPTNAVTRARGIVDTGIYHFILKVIDENLLENEETTTVSVTNVSTPTEGPVISNIGKLLSSNGVESEDLKNGIGIDVNRFGTSLLAEVDIFQIIDGDCDVTLTLTSLTSQVVYSITQVFTDSGKITIPIDLSDVPIGTPNNKRIYPLTISVVDSLNRSTSYTIISYIYSSIVLGESIIIVDEESITEHSSMRVVTVTVPPGEVRDTEVLLSDPLKCTISPAVGTISENTQYTMEITTSRVGGLTGQGVERITLKSKKNGLVEAVNELERGV